MARQSVAGHQRRWRSLNSHECRSGTNGRATSCGPCQTPYCPSGDGNWASLGIPMPCISASLAGSARMQTTPDHRGCRNSIQTRERLAKMPYNLILPLPFEPFLLSKVNTTCCPDFVDNILSTSNQSSTLTPPTVINTSPGRSPDVLAIEFLLTNAIKAFVGARVSGANPSVGKHSRFDVPVKLYASNLDNLERKDWGIEAFNSRLTGSHGLPLRTRNLFHPCCNKVLQFPVQPAPIAALVAVNMSSRPRATLW